MQRVCFQRKTQQSRADVFCVNLYANLLVMHCVDACVYVVRCLPYVVSVHLDILNICWQAQYHKLRSHLQLPSSLLTPSHPLFFFYLFFLWAGREIIYQQPCSEIWNHHIVPLCLPSRAAWMFWNGRRWQLDLQKRWTENIFLLHHWGFHSGAFFAMLTYGVFLWKTSFSANSDVWKSKSAITPLCQKYTSRQTGKDTSGIMFGFWRRAENKQKKTVIFEEASLYYPLVVVFGHCWLL